MSVTEQTPEQIAAGLTTTQRQALRYDRFPPAMAQYREHRTYAALQRKGLLEFRHIIAGRGDFLLTPLGLAVRSLIQENGSERRN